MKEIIEAQLKVIRENSLYNWFEDYPWLQGFIGNSSSPIWFLGENPSLSQVDKQSRKAELTENLQWNASAGDQLLRDKRARVRFCAKQKKERFRVLGNAGQNVVALFTVAISGVRHIGLPNVFLTRNSVMWKDWSNW
jgi:hypothetical protein